MAAKKPAKGKKTNAVAKRKANAVTKSAPPDYIPQEQADLDIQPGELSMPFLKLLQATSGEVNCEMPFGKAGEFYNTANEAVLGTEVYFISVLLNRTKIMWKDFDDGGGMDCISYDNRMGSTFGLCADCVDPDTQIKRCEFGPNGEKPLCTKYYDFVSVILPGEPEIDETSRIITTPDDFSIESLSVIAFGTTKIAAARRLIMIAQAKKAALYANVFKMTRKFVEAKGNKFYVPEVEWYGWVSPEIYTDISENLKSLKAMAGNPENYIKEETEDSPREADFQSENVEESTEKKEAYTPNEDNDDLPF